MPTTYLDANGNPIPAQSAAAPTAPKTYLDDSGNPIAPPKPTFSQSFDKATQTEPIDTSSVGGFAKSVANNLGAGAARVFSPLVHPLDTAASLAETARAGMGDSGAQYDVALGMARPLVENPSGEAVAAIPQVALALAGGGEKGAVTNAVDASGEGGGTVSNGVQMAKNYIRPSTSPSVVPRTEMAARNLAAAVLPATKDASDFIKAAAQEMPNVLDYAKRTGNPLNTQLEFSKAAQGYAQEVRGVYENSILGPTASKLVKTTGTGFGRQMGEGPDTYATLGDIDKQIVAINKQLDAPALNADDARRALASKQDLQKQASGLKDILHSNLAETTGLTPNQVADVRQRVGRSYELANDTDAAVTARMQAAAKADLAPLKPTQLPTMAFNKFIRGGPVSVADRAFQSAVQQFPGEATPIPAVTAPAPMPTAPIDRLQQLLSVARQQQERIKYMNP